MQRVTVTLKLQHTTLNKGHMVYTVKLGVPVLIPLNLTINYLDSQI